MIIESSEQPAELDELQRKVEQLQHALESRIIIEQAKGVLAERLATTVDDAFELLRYAARSHRTQIHDLAHRVVHEHHTPAPIIVAIARTQRWHAARMREIAEAQHQRVTQLQREVANHLEHTGKPR